MYVSILSQDKFCVQIISFLFSFFQIQWVTRTELKWLCGFLFLKVTLRSYNFFLGFKHSIHFQMLFSLTIHFRYTSITSFNLSKYICSASETYTLFLRRVKIDADVGNVTTYFDKNKILYARIYCFVNWWNEKGIICLKAHECKVVQYLKKFI